MNKQIYVTALLIFNTIVGGFSLLMGEKFNDYLVSAGFSKGLYTTYIVILSISMLASIAFLLWVLLAKKEEVEVKKKEEPPVQEFHVNSIQEQLKRQEKAFEAGIRKDWNINKTVEEPKVTPKPLFDPEPYELPEPKRLYPERVQEVYDEANNNY